MRYIILLIFLSFLAACNPEFRCIDASDFGQPNAIPPVAGYDVGSRYEGEGNYDFIEKTTSMPTGFVLTGDDLIVRVFGAWSAWSSGELIQGVCGVGEGDEDSEYYGKTCTIGNDFEPETVPGSNLQGYKFIQNIDCGNDTTEPNICWFAQGIGIYIGLSINPEQDLEELFHLANGTVNGNYYEYTIPSSTLSEVKANIGVSNWEEIRIFVRLHDNSYGDNIYGCIDEDDITGVPIPDPGHNQIKECNTPIELKFMSGARAEEGGFLQSAAEVFIDSAQSVIHSVFNALVGSDTYQNLLFITMSLFIAFLAIGFLTAFIQVSNTELVTILFRFSFIFLLVSPDSWEFFNLFVVEFIFGASAAMANTVLENFYNVLVSQGFSTSITDQTVQVSSASATIDASILQNVDDILTMFTSSAVRNKIWGLLFSHELGWFYIPAIYAAFIVMIFAVVKLAAVFVFVFIALTILMSAAPIFILFLLFKYTRENYFNKWLQAVIGNAVQPMLLFIFIGFFLSMIVGFLMEMLYYTVCWNPIFERWHFVPIIKNLGFWQIEEVYSYNSSTGEVIVKSDGKPDISFVSLIFLFLSCLLIFFVTDMVPKIAEKIAGGISVQGPAQIISALANAAQKQMAKRPAQLAKGTAKRAGRKAVIAAEKQGAAPKSLAKYVEGTKANAVYEAKKSLRKKLRNKGYSEQEIQKEMRGGALQSEIEKEMKYQETKRQQGKYSLNPLKIAKGKFSGFMQDRAIDSAKSRKERTGKRFTQAEERSMREGQADKVYSKLSKSKKAELQNRADDIFTEKYAKKDFDEQLKMIKGGDDQPKSKEELKENLAERFNGLGYDENTSKNLAEKFVDENSKQVSKAFGNLPEASENLEAPAGNSGISPPPGSGIAPPPGDNSGGITPPPGANAEDDDDDF